MNKKFKQIAIPFILMLIINLGSYYLTYGQNFGEGLSPHVGLLLICGLLFGPYGAMGVVTSNFLCDLIRGYDPILAAISAIVCFAISFLAYKLWYNNYKGRLEITTPKLNNTYNILLFIGITLFCALLYSVLHGKLFYLIYPNTIPINNIIQIRYFLNFINASFVFGIIGRWFSDKINFINNPKASRKEVKEKYYKILGICLIMTLILTLIIDQILILNDYIVAFEFTLVTILMFVYLTKPITSDIIVKNSKSIPENIMNRFHITILFIIILGSLIAHDHTLITTVDNLFKISANELVISVMIFVDILLLIFFIPSFGVLKYIETNVIEPIISFTKIEDYIHENEKIETEGLVSIYSKYIDDETEIGTMARSYTELIKFNNNYIENIRKIESEKERIKTELDIARKIQAATLPTESIESDDYIVEGYSLPAKEVGGDFFDYYPLDNDNLAIIIGDASGKGISAAIIAMISQVLIRQLLNDELNPSRILYLLNNQLCKKNSESMFITLWLGIYNMKTKKLTFSNAGHNPPLIRENGKFKYQDIDCGIVLGILDDFNFINETIILTDELIIYTDGITDAKNNDDERYGTDRVLNFLNELETSKNPIKPLLDDINAFSNGAEQFDDITLVYLKTKKDK